MVRRGFKTMAAALAVSSIAAASPARAGEAEDRAEIVNLMMRYGEVHDFGTPEEYAGLFTDDGEIAVGDLVVVKGRDKLLAQAERDHQKYTVPLPNGQTTFLMRHLISNTVVETLDGDRATGTSFVTTIIRDGEEGPKILSVGRYVDVFERRQDEWKIARRSIVLDFGNPELGRKYGFQK